jgi:LacI family transcriptional regulator
MLVGPKPPTAIIAGANQMPGVLKAVRSLRIRVPKRLSLITIGDTDVASLHQPALTAVRWELHKVGAAAAELLLARLNGTVQESRPRRIVLPTELVLRQSCAAPA